MSARLYHPCLPPSPRVRLRMKTLSFPGLSGLLLLWIHSPVSPTSIYLVLIRTGKMKLWECEQSSGSDTPGQITPAVSWLAPAAGQSNSKAYLWSGDKEWGTWGFFCRPTERAEVIVMKKNTGWDTGLWWACAKEGLWSVNTISSAVSWFTFACITALGFILSVKVFFLHSPSATHGVSRMYFLGLSLPASSSAPVAFQTAVLCITQNDSLRFPVAQRHFRGVITSFHTLLLLPSLFAVFFPPSPPFSSTRLEIKGEIFSLLLKMNMVE